MKNCSNYTNKSPNQEAFPFLSPIEINGYNLSQMDVKGICQNKIDQATNHQQEKIAPVYNIDSLRDQRKKRKDLDENNKRLEKILERAKKLKW